MPENINAESRRPRWSPRVPRHKIARLYRQDAKGVRDEDLADEVGIAFLARIEDCLTITEALQGRVKCPECGSIIRRKGRFRQRTANQEILRCTECGWELPWTEYHRSCRKKNMASLGLIEIFREFSREYPKARTYREKMLTIDRLIHRYHWELEGEAVQRRLKR